MISDCPQGVFFVKRVPQPLPEAEKELLNEMVSVKYCTLFHFSLAQTCGDIHPNSLEHFCALVEEVMVPILKNDGNMSKFPECISEGWLMIVCYNSNLYFTCRHQEAGS